MKVVDKEALAKKKKLHRAKMERKIVKMLDHPFLPTLGLRICHTHSLQFCKVGFNGFER